MKKEYESPDMELIRYNAEDVICASGGLEEGTPDKEQSETWGNLNL